MRNPNSNRAGLERYGGVRLLAALMLLAAICSLSLLGSAAANDGAGAPTVTSLEITSDPGDDGVYGVEDYIRVTMTFSENVVVEGFPGLKVVIGDREAKARYESASGAEAVFAAWVSNIDLDTDGVSVKANSLQMFGGSSIEDADGNAANLTHDGLDDDIEHRVGVTPVITGIEIFSDPGDDDTYQRTDTIEFKVSFNIDVRPWGGRPQLNFVIGDGDRVAISNGGSGDGYRFLYYVRWNDQDGDGISFKADALDPNGARLESASGLALVLSSDAVPDDAGHKVDGSPTLELYGNQSPVVPENHRRAIGRYVQTTGFYGQEDPTFGLTGDDSGDFEIASDGTLSFKSPPDFEDPADSNGDNVYEITVTASVPGTKGGSLDVTVSVTDVVERTDPAGAPTITGVAITSDPGDDDTYGLGDSITVSVTFSEFVGVRGTPQIELDVGGEARAADLHPPRRRDADLHLRGRRRRHGQRRHSHRREQNHPERRFHQQLGWKSSGPDSRRRRRRPGAQGERSRRTLGLQGAPRKAVAQYMMKEVDN